MVCLLFFGCAATGVNELLVIFNGIAWSLVDRIIRVIETSDTPSMALEKRRQSVAGLLESTRRRSWCMLAEIRLALRSSKPPLAVQGKDAQVAKANRIKETSRVFIGATAQLRLGTDTSAREKSTAGRSGSRSVHRTWSRAQRCWHICSGRVADPASFDTQSRTGAVSPGMGESDKRERS